jgi:hypothetical protein
VDVDGERPGQSYSQRTTRKIRNERQVALRMKLTPEARKDLANTGRVFAQLETTVRGRDGGPSKTVRWAILVPRSSPGRP